MNVSTFLAQIRRARRQDQPKVIIWLQCWGPNDRLAVVLVQP